MFKLFLVAALMLAAAPLAAQPADADFLRGPAIEEFGATLPVEGATPLPADAQFSVVFDVSESAEPGEINRTLNSAARFLNMHARAGVDPAAMRIAIVVHGRAVRDMTNAAAYAATHDGAENANAAAITALAAHNVTIHVCGQSAGYYEVSAADLLPGVQMELSAMTAHALLQQQGFTLNPF